MACRPTFVTTPQQRLLNWGRRDLAEKVELKSCDEFKELKAKLPPSLRNGFASRY